jgi:hypothetical protein
MKVGEKLKGNSEKWIKVFAFVACSFLIVQLSQSCRQLHPASSVCISFENQFLIVF